MTFEAWKAALAVEISRVFGYDGTDYVAQCGDDCWRAMFDDGLTPTEAVEEEASAAPECI